MRLDLAAAYGIVCYDRLLEVGGVDRSGKCLSNVFDGSVILVVSYCFLRVPLLFGVFSYNVGGFFIDNVNTIYVVGYTIFDAWFGYDWQCVSAVLRVCNFSDALYGMYSGYLSTYIYFGAFRSIELTLRMWF